ncbi:hypothetical protein JCM21714_146 [Gracilibacillus boraciitolerans JCM 21714]|uniref:Uncharacterized protein n=1 Tax=Gracilibacillus boraciitolerans JCM 21714 TaxID=1298598 RepID=W4VCQ8_9BACI|nr:tetratricopeptide repeat protein [Gracilibacillus boraciitolerans]GAE91205.1 hypothetical protein JCM21714_146 [Gracilibacillus boraciitolerans JCM 21714]
MEAAVQQKPNFEEAWYNLALIYQQNENYTKALAAIKQLLLLNPEKEVYQDLYKEI